MSAVSWPWVPAWGSLEPPCRDGENAQKMGKNGEKMGEIKPKTCEGRELSKNQLAGLRAVPAGAFSRQCRLGARASACQRSSLARLWRSARRSSAHGLCRLGFQSSASCARLVSLWECLIADDSRCVQAFLQTNSDLRLFCPSKRIADLVSRSPGRNTSAFLYYFSRGPRPGDWLSNQQVRPSSLLSDADCVQCWCLATLCRGRFFLTAV